MAAGEPNADNSETPRAVQAPRPQLPFVASVIAQFSGPLSATDLALFAELLVGLVRAKLPIPEALRMLARDADTPRLRLSLEGVEKDVAGGMTLGEALRRREGEFPPLFTRLIEQGVESNDLHAALVELVREYRSQARFREALWSQLLSPIATTVVLGTLVFVLACSEVPRLYGEIYYTLRVDLPPTTRFFLSLSEMLHDPKLLMLGAGIVLGCGVLGVVACNNKSLRRDIQLFLLGIPVLGPFLRTIFLGRFCRLVGILLQRRVPLDSALQLTRDCFTYIPFNEAIGAILDRVQNGAQLDAALSPCLLFPPTIIQFIRSGQIHGDLPDALFRLADLFEQRSQIEGSRVRFLIYVIAQMSIGLAVGVMIFSFYYPMFRIQ